jgi:hypothetical protein
MEQTAEGSAKVQGFRGIKAKPSFNLRSRLQGRKTVSSEECKI